MGRESQRDWRKRERKVNDGEGERGRNEPQAYELTHTRTCAHKYTQVSICLWGLVARGCDFKRLF